MGELTGIDFHVHPNTDEFIQARGPRAAHQAVYFRRGENKSVSMDELAEQYRARRMMAVLQNNPERAPQGITAIQNDRIAEAVRGNPDVFIGFMGLDLWDDDAAFTELRRCHEELGMRGIGELNPGRMAFFPNDPRHFPIWEEASKRKLIVLFHTGMMGAGAGTRGGMGYRQEANHPIPYLDDIAAQFPDLTIVGAHPSWPWQAESLAVALHKANYYIDISGWAPKYFPAELVQYARTRLQDKVLFGSDFPEISVERWVTDFERIELPADVRRKIMLTNAQRLLGI